ncbi:MAG: redoxin domain-containing protein [Acidobacteria bacterium]|nr:redoxin domain-containing protein [Acidobacteriota bacterium]MBW4045282.1 redoxin domain-containing protein [Acidobacteriota bacterium]
MRSRAPRRTTVSKISALFAAIALVVVGIGVFTVRARAADDNIPQVGQMAPNFSLPSQEGKDVSLSSMKGKWVVLYFYPKDMTTGCTIEAHNFQNDLQKYRAMNAEIVGVSVDSVNSHKQFCAKDSLNFTLLSDQDKKVVAEYGSMANYMGMKIAKRNTFLINPEGKIVKVWTGVDPNHHSQEVLAELKSMQKKS